MKHPGYYIYIKPTGISYDSFVQLVDNYLARHSSGTVSAKRGEGVFWTTAVYALDDAHSCGLESALTYAAGLGMRELGLNPEDKPVRELLLIVRHVGEFDEDEIVNHVPESTRAPGPDAAEPAGDNGDNNKDEPAWCIPVSWEMSGIVYVPVKTAATLSDAIECIKNGDVGLPAGNYVDDSFSVAFDDEDYIREFYNGKRFDAPVDETHDESIDETHDKSPACSENEDAKRRYFEIELLNYDGNNVPYAVGHAYCHSYHDFTRADAAAFCRESLCMSFESVGNITEMTLDEIIAHIGDNGPIYPFE